MITGKNYVGFHLSYKGNSTFKTFNPQLNIENPWRFVEANSDEIKQATLLAQEAFITYQQCTGFEKATFLRAIADEILKLRDSLLEVYGLESGLTSDRALIERTRTLGQLYAFADLIEEGSWVEATIDTAISERKPIPKVDLRKMLIPIGPIVVFGSSNFPFAYSTAGGDTASALAAGCPVIVKSHPMHAGTGEMVASAVIKAAKKTHMPEGVFSNLNGAGYDVGTQLVKDENVKGVGFTGSIKGGRALFDLAAQRPEPIPVFAEMGSINPVVIFPKALELYTPKWAKSYALSITQGTGQFCTNPGLLLGLESSHLKNFISQLAQEIEKIVPTCMLHPSIHSNFIEGSEKLSTQNGVKQVFSTEGSIPFNYARQTLLTVSGKEFMENPTLHQEVFGPFSLIVQCHDAQELELIISKLEGQLTGTILGEENEMIQFTSIVNALKNRVGRVIFNGVPTGVEVCPSMMHGGPYPASTDSRFTAVGINSIKRWVRPVSFQNFPENLLPLALQNSNPLGIRRLINNYLTIDSIV
jgi:NADP-dependent aldehyde dehydrogenase